MEKGQFYILRNVGENIILVQLMDSAGNVNLSVSIVVYWIFDSSYKKALPLTLDQLNIICSPLEGEVTFDMFDTVFHAGMYINSTGKLNTSDQRRTY